MKRVLVGIGAVVLLACGALGIGVASKVRQENEVNAYCAKTSALAKQANVELNGDVAKCEAHASFLADQSAPMAKRVWESEKKCAEQSDTWAKLEACKLEASKQLASP